MRLDKALVEQGFVATRAKAQDAIKEGRVLIDGKVQSKNSFEVTEAMRLELKEATQCFVSRAGFKLYDVLRPFDVRLQGRIVMDVGASTGGFSDVCLQEGASLVYALDVGCDQMDPSLLKDERLHNMEHVNCRFLEPSMFEMTPDFACIDVSFISLKLILPAVISCMEQVEIVALVKPQFEAGKAAIGKHGIIKDRKVHARVLRELYEYIIDTLKLSVHHIRPSSVKGRDGNQEYVIHIKAEPCSRSFDFECISKQNIDQR